MDGLIDWEIGRRSSSPQFHAHTTSRAVLILLLTQRAEPRMPDGLHVLLSSAGLDSIYLLYFDQEVVPATSVR